MQISRFFHALKLAAVPVLFSVAAIGLTAVHISLERKAERAKARAAEIVAVQNGWLPNAMLSVKFKDLAAVADTGDLAANVEMGRRLALGHGVNKNEGQAARYFEAVIGKFGNVSAHDKRAPQVATAFRYLAHFHKSGVPEAKIAADPKFAFSLLHHAASYLADPIAQFELAKLLINGDGVGRNTHAGAQWLLNASRKGYAPAQALLGQLLWRGEGIKRVPGDGLGLLAIARHNASPDDKPWVSKMFETARAEALPIEILEANAFIVQEANSTHFGMANDSLISGETAPSKPDAASKQSSLIEGSSQPLPELASSAILAPDADRFGSAGKKSAETSAGIFQMYGMRNLEVRVQDPTPIKIARVSN